jgi:hypothetical protein
MREPVRCNSAATAAIVVKPVSGPGVIWLGINNPKVLLQGASKTNIALIVADEEASAAVQGLHCEFFEPKL